MMKLRVLVVLCTAILPMMVENAPAVYQLQELGYPQSGTSANRFMAETQDFRFDYGPEARIDFPLPWAFPFNGASYNQLTAHANGRVELTGDGPTVTVAAWNADLSPYYYGGVFVQHLPDPEQVVVEWQSETFLDQGYGRLNVFRTILTRFGFIRFDYDDFAAQVTDDDGSGIVGGTVNLSLTNTYGAVPTLSGRSFLSIDDPDADFDGDNLTNLKEYFASADPTSSDTDGDGISDSQDFYPTLTPVLSLSPTSIDSNEKTTIEISVANLAAPGGTVTLKQVLDLDHNAKEDPDESEIRIFTVTDGMVASNPNVHGDQDGVGDGVIRTTIAYYNNLDRYHAPADYVFYAVSGPALARGTFTVNPVSSSQSISGTLTDGANPVSGAFIQIQDKWHRPAGYSVTDNLGRYQIEVTEPGEYYLSPEALGYTTHLADIPRVDLPAGENFIDVDLRVTAETTRVFGQIYDNISIMGIKGLPVAAKSANVFGISLTDDGGNFSFLLPPGDYTANVVMADGASPAFKGYVAGPNQTENFTLVNDYANLDFQMTPATVLVSGTVHDDFGIPLPGLPVKATVGASQEPLAYAITDASGDFTLGLSPRDDWTISVDEDVAQGLGFIGNPLVNVSTTGTLTGQDLTVKATNASIGGSVKNSNNVPVGGIPIALYDNSNLIHITMNTAHDGTYRFDVYAGNWVVQATTEAFGYRPVSEHNLTLDSGQTTIADFLAVPQDTFTINANTSVGGTINPNGSIILVSGEEKEFSIQPDPGYRIADVIIDGISQGAVPTYIFSAVSANHTISASFVPETHTITSSAGANGNITPLGSISVLSSQSQNFAISATAGYWVADVVVDGLSLGSLDGFTFDEISADHAIHATFGPTITASAGPGGGVSPATAYIVTGANATFTIAAAEGFHVSNVLVDGASVGGVPSYTFNNVTDLHTISVTFAPDQDIFPPIISNLAADPSETLAVITWDTDEISTSKVKYGLTTGSSKPLCGRKS